MSTRLTPRDLNLPAKFHAWRPGQIDAIETIVSTDQRFVAGAFPTGTGKSVLTVASGKINGGRTVILTSTKMLAEQYLSDFSDCGMVEMRGQSNFHCTETYKRNATCADGRKLKCPARISEECEYIRARKTFLESSLSVTNYDYYLSSIIHGDGCGPVDLLVLDEAHTAVQQLSDAITITLNHLDNEPFYMITGTPPFARPIPEWKEWSRQAILKIKNAKFMTHGMDSDEKFSHFTSALKRLSEIPTNWIAEHDTDTKSSFAPLWPTEYAKEILFASAKKVLLVSATIVPKTLHLLDIQDSESLFLQTNYSFPVHRAPVYLFGAHRIDFRTSPAQWIETIARMDALIDRRTDRKGIIHSVSYDRQKFISTQSRHRDTMISPISRFLRDEVNRFRRQPPPSLLVSPALTTGYDFPGRECEYQIIVKLPFVDTRGAVMKARVNQDPEYANYMTAQTLTQMCGRPMRSPSDQCENFILDTHMNWFWRTQDRKGFRHLFPSWFVPLVRWANDAPPQPPPPLDSAWI
jgi:Rad3-related DNA helicase